jgi:hypothetical protein
MGKTKICSTCEVEKEIDFFNKHKSTKDGYCFECKNCRKIRSKKYYNNLITKNKLPIEVKICSNCKLEKKIDFFHKHIGTKNGYRSMCVDCRKNKFVNDYPKIMDNHRRRNKEYREKNKKLYNQYFKKRYIKMSHLYAWRGLLSYVLRRVGSKKQDTTHNILGYSATDLKNHLEKLFVDGMSWKNWGEWHIDHIRPISSFNKDDDPKIINSLDNLQPLWKSDNIKKSNKLYGK